MSTEEISSRPDVYTPRRRLKVLISAYACEPGRGSEHGNGWNTILQLSRYHEVWAMVTAEYRPPIDKYLAQNPLPNVHFHFVDFPRQLVAWRTHRQMERVHYHLWQHYAYGAARQLHRQVRFDAAMHVTFGSYWRPSFLRLLDIPYIWGPVGGAENIPLHFYDSLDEASLSWDRRKRKVEDLACRYDPTVHQTASKAALTLVPTAETEKRVRALGARNIELIPQLALPLQELEKLGQIPIRASGGATVRFISMGRVLGWKGIHLGLRAFARLVERFPDAEYVHDGMGGDFGDELRRLAQELGVADKFRLLENNTRQQALDNLAQSDVLMFPCLHNEPGWVVLEAMAAGKPIVYLLGRPQTPGVELTGFSADSTSIETAINSMADSMYRLATSPELRIQMGTAAREHVWQYFNFDVRGIQYARMLDQILTPPQLLSVRKKQVPQF